MGIETAAIIGGAAASGIGSAISGHAKAKSAQQANDANAQQHAYINQIGANLMNQNASPSYWQQQLMSGMTDPSFGKQQLLGGAPSYNPTQASAMMASPASYSSQGYSPTSAGSQGYQASTTDIGGFLAPFMDQSGFFKPATATAGQSSVGGFTAKEIQAALAGKPMNVGEQQIDLPSITRLIGQNAGNDALMQFLRSDPMRQTGAADSQLTQMLATGKPYNTSDLFSAQQGVNDVNYRRALADAQGAFGTLGARFGSAGQQRIARSTSDLTAQQNLLNAQIGQSSFENASQRQMQAAGMLNDLEAQRRNSFIQAALGSGGLGAQQAQLLLSGSQANQGANLEAQRLNQGADLQTNLANQGAMNQIGLANQGSYNAAGMQTQQLGAQSSMANAANQTQASLANAAAQNAQKMAMFQMAGQLQGQNMGFANQASQFGTGAANQASLFNAGASNDASQFGAAASNLAAQNNAQFLQQAGLANQGAFNANSQFNAGQQNAANQFNIGSQFQTQSQNNAALNSQTAMLLQALGLGSTMQQGQNNYNLGLLGTMAGQPQPQPNPYAGWMGDAIGDIGGMGMIAGMMGGRQQPAQASNPMSYLNPYSLGGAGYQPYQGGNFYGGMGALNPYGASPFSQFQTPNPVLRFAP